MQQQKSGKNPQKDYLCDNKYLFTCSKRIEKNSQRIEKKYFLLEISIFQNSVLFFVDNTKNITDF